MAKVSVKSMISDLLSDQFKENEYAHLFLIKVTYHRNTGLIRVYIDGDSGVTFSDCQRVSRYLETFLDDHSDLRPDYRLEVSSPGVKQPLVLARQYPQHIGRVLEITRDDKKTEKFILKDVIEEVLVFETIPKMKKKKASEEKKIIELHHSEIKEAIVKISFDH